MFPSSVESSARRHHCVHLPLFQSFLNTVCRSEVLLVGCLIIEVNFFVTVKENVQNKCHRICSLNDTLHLYGSILHLFNYLLAFPWKFSDMFSEQQVHNAHRGFRRKKRDVKFSEGEREAVFSVQKCEVQLEYCDVDESLNGYRKFKNVNGPIFSTFNALINFIICLRSIMFSHLYHDFPGCVFNLVF